MRVETNVVSPEPDDALLLAAFVGRADQKAFRQLVERYHRMVFAVSYRGLNRHAAAAEDATQAVFILLARKASGIKPAALSGWLFKTTLQVAHTMRREDQRRKKREACMAKASIAPESLAASLSLDHSQRDQALHAAIARLPSKQRDAILLYYFAGLDQAAIGERLGCSSKAVQKRIEYALACLRSKLGRHSWAATLNVVYLALEQARNLHAPSGLAARCLSAASSGAAAATVPAQIANQLLRKAVLKTWTTVTTSSAAAILVVLALFFYFPRTPAPSVAVSETSAAPAVLPPVLPAPQVATVPKPLAPVASPPVPAPALLDPAPPEPFNDTPTEPPAEPAVADLPPPPENPPPASQPAPPRRVTVVTGQWNLAPARTTPATRPANRRP